MLERPTFLFVFRKVGLLQVEVKVLVAVVVAAVGQQVLVLEEGKKTIRKSLLYNVCFSFFFCVEFTQASPVDRGKKRLHHK